jgi:hypothetical protein
MSISLPFGVVPYKKQRTPLELGKNLRDSVERELRTDGTQACVDALHVHFERTVAIR